MRKMAMCGLLLLSTCAAAFSQDNPRGTSSLDLRGNPTWGNPSRCPIQNACRVSVEYGRPSLRGRTVDEVLGNLKPGSLWQIGVAPRRPLRLKSAWLLVTLRFRLVNIVFGCSGRKTTPGSCFLTSGTANRENPLPMLQSVSHLCLCLYRGRMILTRLRW